LIPVWCRLTPLIPPVRIEGDLFFSSSTAVSMIFITMKDRAFIFPGTIVRAAVLGSILLFLNNCASDDASSGDTGASNQEQMNYNFAPGPGRSPYRPGGNVP
jgi:hypothetical protein